MYRFARTGVVLAIALFCVQLLPAQPPEGGPRGRWGGMMGMGPLAMLNSEQVQKELKLTDDQIKKVTDLGKQMREKHQADFAKLRDLDDSERRAKMDELMKTVGEESKKSLAGVLKPEQEKRLHQLQMQREGAQAFLNPEVQSELKLTGEQKDKIKTITDDENKEMTELFQGGGFRENRQKIQTIRKESLENVTAVLTDSQKKTWKEMTGEPFHFEMGQRRGGGDNR
jgi:Spy/CpxP family protein refolding chaperone